MKFSLKKLQRYIVEPLPTLDVLREKIIFHAFEVESVEEIAGDYELDIKVLPDRAFDAKDERGMAREIAALFDLNLIEPDHYNASTGAQIVFSLEHIGILLGREVTSLEIEKMFNAYHYVFTINNDQVTLIIPPWRNDIVHVYDIADEVGRYLGYNNIPAILPNLSKKNPLLAEEGAGGGGEYLAIMNKKQVMVEQGYHEVMTYSLTKKGDYQVAKGPKGKDFLRKNLLDGLRVAYALNKQNEELLPNATSKIFEIGKVFLKPHQTPLSLDDSRHLPLAGENTTGIASTNEELHIAWIDEKGEHEEVLAVEKTLSTIVERVGTAGDRVRTDTKAHFTMWSEYPFMTRDIAVWLPESVSSTELVEIIKRNGTELLQGEPRLFDQFTKDGRISYAYRMIFQAFDRTLTDEELTPITNAIYEACKANGWEIR